MKTATSLFAMAALLCLLFTGCANMMKAKSLAQSQVSAFHKVFNAEDYSTIYSTCSPEFQKTTSEEKLTMLLKSIHRKLGAVKSTATQGWNVNTDSSTTRIVLTQSTEFEKGSATETFSFFISGTDAILLGYNIESEDLINR